MHSKGCVSSTHCRLHKAPADAGPPMSPPPSPPLLGHTAGCRHLLFTPCSRCTGCAKTPPQACRQLSELVPRPRPPHHLGSHFCASSTSSWTHPAFHFCESSEHKRKEQCGLTRHFSGVRVLCLPGIQVPPLQNGLLIFLAIFS